MRPDLFDEPTMAELADRFVRLLDADSRNPKRLWVMRRCWPMLIDGCLRVVPVVCLWVRY